MSLSDDVQQALRTGVPNRVTVAGHSFPSIGLRPEDAIDHLEIAIASLANAIDLISQRLDQLEGSGGR